MHSLINKYLVAAKTLFSGGDILMQPEMRNQLTCLSTVVKVGLFYVMGHGRS